MQERKVVQIEDVRLDAEFQLKELIVIGDYRTLLGVPLLREGVPVGVMVLVRCVVLPFTEKQIELLTTFADQAVIAIENVRLFDEVKARTEDLRQSLEYQTAISSVLGVISPLAVRYRANTGYDSRDSPASLPVRTRIHYAPAGRQVPSGGGSDVQPDRIKYLSENPVVPNRGSLVGRVALECRPVHILDASSDKEYTLSMTGDPGYRTMLGVPLLRDSVAIGVIVLTKGIVAPFSDRQIELVSTFADQALIAIENVRLFDELNARTNDLREFLQQQTATADVLKVISRSAFDLQTVFDTLVESATRLCEADHAWVFTRDGDCLHWTASYGHALETHARIRDFFRGRDVPIDRGSIVGRSTVEGRVVHIADVLADPEYTWSAAQQIGGYRAALGVPLLRDGLVVGVIFVTKSRSAALYGQADRTGLHLRRPGGDRYRKCPVVRGGAGAHPRPHGIAGAADRYLRSAGRDQQLARGAGSAVPENSRKRGSRLRRQIRHYEPL